jgi:hypothetical protein
MTYVAVALAAFVILLVLLRERDARLLERLLVATAAERSSLLDRIQHPERAQVTPVEREPIDPPRDSAELAFVGQIVPEGVQVGTLDGD